MQTEDLRGVQKAPGASDVRGGLDYSMICQQHGHFVADAESAIIPREGVEEVEEVGECAEVVISLSQDWVVKSVVGPRTIQGPGQLFRGLEISLYSPK